MNRDAFLAVCWGAIGLAMVLMLALSACGAPRTAFPLRVCATNDLLEVTDFDLRRYGVRVLLQRNVRFRQCQTAARAPGRHYLVVKPASHRRWFRPEGVQRIYIQPRDTLLTITCTEGGLTRYRCEWWAEGQ